MAKPIYLLKGRLYRNNESDENDLIEILEEFCDDNPILARKRAFSMFRSYVDVLMESKDLSYQSHHQAEHAIQPFVNSNKKQLLLSIQNLALDVDFDKGLFLYFIPNPNKKSLTKENELYYEEKHCIHFIDNKKTDLRRYILNSLIFEFNYYDKHNLNMDDQDCWTYKRGVSGKICKVSILNTPLTNLFEIV